MEHSKNQRLRDLDDKDSKTLVSKIMDFLDSAQGSTELANICDELELPTLLVEDLIELLIIKEWLILPKESQ